MTTYSAADVIQLPRLQASGAMALGGQLIAAARPHKKTLSRSLAKALSSLDAQRIELSDAIRDHVAPELVFALWARARGPEKLRDSTC